MGRIPRLTRTFPVPTGFIAKGFQEVLNVFVDSFSKGLDRGASFAAYYKGKPVVHIWGGYADEDAHRPWQADTMAFFHSTTKFISAVTIAHLVDRGLVNYEEKIASFWPSFAQNGKEDITLDMLVSNRAGLVALDEVFDLCWLKDDPKRLTRALEVQKPFWEPGEQHGYHPFTFGLYLDQVVRRTDRKCRSLAQYFHEEIALPFGIDLYVGLPKPLHYRAVRLEPQEDHFEYLSNMMDLIDVDSRLYHQAFTQPGDWTVERILNNPDFAELECGASHGVGTALAAAKLAGILANGGQHEGRVLLSPETISLLNEPISYGTDQTTSSVDVYSRGTILQPIVQGSQHWFSFGHTGYGDQNAMADPQRRVGWAYLTNYIDPMVTVSGKNKWKPLMEALFSVVDGLEGIKEERRVLTSLDQLKQEGFM